MVEPDEEDPDEEDPDEEDPDDEELVLERGAGAAVRVGVGAVRGAFSVGADLVEAAAFDDGVVVAAGVWAAWACAIAPPMATAPTTAAIAVVAVRRSTRRVCVSR